MLTAEIIRKSAGKARNLGQSFVGSAHLLMAMAEQQGSVGNVLRGFGVSASLTEDMAVVLYGKGIPGAALPQGLTPNARKILRGAAKEAESCGAKEITPMHLLLALSRRRGTTDAGQLLGLQGVDAGELFTCAVQTLQWEGKMTVKRLVIPAQGMKTQHFSLKDRV